MEESCASAVTFKLYLQKPLGVQGCPSKASKQRKRRAERYPLSCFIRAATTPSLLYTHWAPDKILFQERLQLRFCG